MIRHSRFAVLEAVPCLKCQTVVQTTTHSNSTAAKVPCNDPRCCGKTILVTGVASGIGARTSRLLTEGGAHVIGLDRRKPDAHDGKFIAADLSDPASIESAVAQIDDSLDGLCNVAGVPPTQGRTLVLQVNFLGLRRLTELLIERMHAGAAIVNVASLAGSGWRDRLPVIKAFLADGDFSSVSAFCTANGIDDENCYPFSKELLIAWTITHWNAWLERGIRMNCVSPGPVETPILDDFRRTIGKRFRDEVMLLDKKAATVDEVASVIAFLCSDDSRWIRGADIPVDAGIAASVARKRAGL